MVSFPVLRIYDILMWIRMRIYDILIWIRMRIRGSMPLTNGSDPGIFVIDLQGANRKLIIFKSFSAYYFLQVHLHHISKIKSQREVTKQ
jgi:hypothetical protein